MSGGAAAMTDRPALRDLRRQARLLALLALAGAIHVLESALPGLGPWFKPGLANIVTLLAMAGLGVRAALIVGIGRIVIGAAFIGTLFTPTFVISLGAGLAATAGMIAAWRLLPGISLIGASLIGASLHMCAQFAIVETLFIHHAALWQALPPLLLLSLATGWLNGGLAVYIAARMGWINTQ
ncbi:MAG: Gx transporter family protein [Mariprofundaceae bacterium]